MTVESSPVKFRPTLPGQPVPEVRRLSNGRPVFRAELPDGRIVWLVSGYENVRQMITDPRFSRARAVAPDRAQQGFEMFAAGSINGMDPPEHTRLQIGGERVHRSEGGGDAAAGGEYRRRVARRAAQSAPASRLVSGFSLPLLAQVICEMLGVPAEDT